MSCSMRNKERSAVLRRLLAHARYEVLPTAAIEEQVLEHLPDGFTVTVTASQSKGLAATLDLTERLSAQGYDVVPHLAARMVSGRSELSEICARLMPLGTQALGEIQRRREAFGL